VTTFVVTEPISGGGPGQTHSISTHPNSNGMAVATKTVRENAPQDFPLRVNSTSTLLVAEDLGNQRLVVIRVMQFPEDQALVAVLKKIAKLRAAPDLPAVLVAATSEFDLLSAVGLNRLMGLPEAKITAANAGQLQALADEAGRDPNLRILAEETGLHFSESAASARTVAEYTWLRGVLEAARQNPASNPADDYQVWGPFFTKMFEFKDRKLETADYALGLVADEKVVTAVRATACGALSHVDEQVFRFDQPDERFDRMFTTYVNLLRDKTPEMRIEGLSMLFDRTVTILLHHPKLRPNTVADPIVSQQYIQKAVDALQNAIKVETDPKVMNFLQGRLWIYQERSKAAGRPAGGT